MTQWTESARAELDAWCQRARERIAGTGADADEVVEDFRAHVDTEVRKRELSVVNVDDLRQILTLVGEPESTSTTAPAEPRLSQTELPPKTRPGIALFLFGVVLPVITLGIELATHMCAGAFFDPIPTWWHVLVVAMVPIINGVLWRAARDGANSVTWGFNMISGLAVGIGVIYALMFLPLMIPGIFAVFIFGWGLLPWSPCLALITTLKLRAQLKGGNGGSIVGFGRRAYVLGMLTGAVALLAPEIPSGVTRVAMQWADSEVPALQRRGLTWLRSIGHDETMLRLCYERTRQYLDFAALFVSRGDTLTQEEARNIFFRVTGKPFNSVPPPPLYSRAGRWDMMEEEFTWNFDTGLGGDAVAGRIKGLSMIASRIDGTIESDAALGYYEWIMEFRNDARVQREARAQIALPAGGVVSRLTLWINGEEREAAFGGRGEVRAAYQQVAVQQRRDPVLVTTAGPDRVLMQCFPVPPDGGTMKVRVGITAPLALSDERNGRLAWPQFLERNFNLTTQLRHSVWMESRASLNCAAEALHQVQREDRRSGLQGELDDRQLHDPVNHLNVTRAEPMASGVWTASPDGGRVEQTLTIRTNLAPARVVAVLDCSAAMADEIGSVATALASLPANVELRVIAASDDDPAGWTDLAAPPSAPRNSLLDRVRALRPTGGQDNIPALRQAWDLAAKTKGGVVLWIHGPQPVLLDSVEGLRQRLERNVDRTRLIDFQTDLGPNRVAEKLDGLGVASAVRAGTVGDDLGQMLALWADGQVSWNFERVHHTAATSATGGKEVSKHIARLWALEEVQRLMRQRHVAAATKLAAEHQLVTPVSGAVVLETQAQYQLAGLTPVDAATVPIVPEPSTWVLLVFGGVMMALLTLRKRILAKPTDQSLEVT